MNDPLLELVPWEQHEFGLPLFTLLRAPTSLDAFDWQTYRSVIIRCENHTLIFICEKGFLHLNTPNVFFTIDVNNKYKLEGAIYGATDAVIVETATFSGRSSIPKESQEPFSLERITAFALMPLHQSSLFA